jgi:hypothetical protein
VSGASEFSTLSIVVHKITTVPYGVNKLLRSTDSMLADRRKRIFVEYGNVYLPTYLWFIE